MGETTDEAYLRRRSGPGHVLAVGRLRPQRRRQRLRCREGGAATSGPDVEINMSDLPHPKPGLWQNVIDDGDGKPDTITSCLSGKTPTMPKMPAGCSQFSIKRTFLGHIVMDMNCTTPQFTMVMHSEATGDFQSNMSSDATMTMSGPNMPAKTHQDAHRGQLRLVPARRVRRRTTSSTRTRLDRRRRRLRRGRPPPLSSSPFRCSPRAVLRAATETTKRPRPARRRSATPRPADPTCRSIPPTSLTSRWGSGNS